MDLYTLRQTEDFSTRHLGSSAAEIEAMLQVVGAGSLDALTAEILPKSIQKQEPMALAPGKSEAEALATLRDHLSLNNPGRAMIGEGYYGCQVPAVIQRNILENPGWYTAYTPYQPEISQGRLEALVNFQTVISDMTGLPLANASLLDEGTAAAEALTMCVAASRGKKTTLFVADDCHPSTIAVIQGRGQGLGWTVEVGPIASFDPAAKPYAGVLVQYPNTDGLVADYAALAAAVHAQKALFVVATDLLALALLTPPGEFGADIAVGSAQRFGTPMCGGGPHAGFMATTEAYKRIMPGRIIGVSKDVEGRPAYRLALQTREQHIRRDKATSNICTAQALLAIMSGMYAVYHGPDGIRRIAERVQDLTELLAAGLVKLGFKLIEGPRFGALRVQLDMETAEEIVMRADAQDILLRRYECGDLGCALDELSSVGLVEELWEIFVGEPIELDTADVVEDLDASYPAPLSRESGYLSHPVFSLYHSEHELLRYLHRLEVKDLALNEAMIPLGSCTMKLNATAEMMPLSWPELADLHPYAPVGRREGFWRMVGDLERWIAEITGLHSVSMQPPSGAHGEYTGLLVVRAYQRAQGEGQRDVCLIPTSAHGTNPASAVMAGLKVVPVRCDQGGNIDMADLEDKAKQHADKLAAVMVTYPSTHGVFEAEIVKLCEIVHANGGQVYMDGANMNAQVGLCSPGEIGADVCHLNLHKTFAVPHGGGGPGVGPIAVAEHLAPFLPGHPAQWLRPTQAILPVASAPYGSAGVAAVSWMYIAMMGPAGLRRATQLAILNANYMAERLKDHFPILYTGVSGKVGHEFILDTRTAKAAGITVDDIAKRLMDFGFHAPTMSFPVPGTLMVEPTESESKAELDRFCEAMITIAAEIEAVQAGRLDAEDNPLKRAPHPAQVLIDGGWSRAYPPELGAYPVPSLSRHKYWPAVSRVDNAWGDRNLMCSCPPMSDFEE